MKRILIGIALGATTLALTVAQDSWHTHRGSNQRTGTTGNARDSVVNFLLSWSLPDIGAVQARVTVDNDNSTQTTRAGRWRTPAANERAADFYTEQASPAEPYVYATGVLEPNPDQPPVAYSTFTWRSGSLKAGYYRVFVYLPAQPTRIGGRERPYLRAARYLVSDSQRADQPFFLNQRRGGGWIQIGNLFYCDGFSQITVTLQNAIPLGSPDRDDYDPDAPPIAVADAIRFVPDYGTVQASPVAIRNPLNPSNHLVYIANGNGTITCMEHPVNAPNARVRWTLRVPDLPDQGAGVIYDDDGLTQGDFSSSSVLDDRYGTRYYEIEPTSDLNRRERAFWTVPITQSGQYYIYAWFPSASDNARKAEYVIQHADGDLRVRVDQRFGGRWVLLNRVPVPMQQGSAYQIEVNNYSPEDVAQGAQRVIADAIRVVSADGLTNAVFSTPAVGRLRVRDGNTTATRWVVVFAAQNGAVYAADALGDGENNTRRGETKIYWIAKPNTSASFSYASPLILESKNLIAIGNPSGSVYLIRSDFNPNALPDDPDGNPLRWEYRRPGGAFVSTPAYDSDTDLIYIGAVLNASQFGQLIALDPDRQDDPDTPEDERVAWLYPPPDAKDRELQAVDAITSTPAVFEGRVYFTTSTLFRGRVFAVDARTGNLAWRYPPAPTDEKQPDNEYLPIPPYASPLLVKGLIYAGQPTNALYVGGADGRVYGLYADTGAPLSTNDPNQPSYISERLGGALFSSPVFTRVRDRDPDGNILGDRPAIVAASDSGLLLALHPNETTNSRGGKAFEGWRLYGEGVFASPAVLDDWLYAADNNGIAYAFHLTGVANAGELGENDPEPTPTPEEETDGSDYTKLKVTVLSQKADLDRLINGEIAPDQLPNTSPNAFPEALEWGQAFYVVAWNFKRTANNTSTLTVRLSSPYNTSKDFPLTNFAELPRPPESDPDRNGYAWVRIELRPDANFTLAPGKGYTLGILYRRSGDASGVANPDLNWATDGRIDRPAAGNGEGPTDPNDPSVGWSFGVANPIGLRGIGAVGGGGTSANLEQGNQERVFVSFNGQAVGQGEHGKQVSGVYEIYDRRQFDTRRFEYATIDIQARAFVDDLRWQGGPSAVLRQLPWEISPSFYNNSPDYPDISSRQLAMLADGASNLQRTPARILSTGNTVQTTVSVPRYQPANTQPGYLSVAKIFIDTNNNGRFEGFEDTLRPLEPNERRIVEAYREVSASVIVQVDERLFVEEQVLDFGALPGGFGFNWGNLFANHPLSAFRPDNPIFSAFWKPFTVRNEGNVNLFPVYLGKAFNNPQGTEFLFSDMVSFFAGIPAWTTVSSTLDTRFWPQPNPFYPGGNQPYPILQKPQVGDYTSTVLSQPAVPPRRNPDIIVEPRKPLVSVAVPPFQPMGVYSQLIAPYQHNPGAIPGVVNGTFATPPMRVVVRVRETQLTGSTNQGVTPMIDGTPPPNAPRVSDVTPAAFREPATGKMHLYWASNRPDPVNRPNSFYLYKATLDWNTTITSQDGVRATNGWRPESFNRWWGATFGPYPDDPNGNLFSQALGLGRTLTSAEAATIKHHRPFIRQAGNVAFLFWTGEVILRNQKYELLFYVRLNPITGEPQGNPQAVPLDPVMPRSSLAITGVDGVGNWLFYVAAPSGRSQVFYISSDGDLFANWRREQRLPLSGIVRSVESVAANIYRVSADPNAANSNFLYLADVFFIGTVGDRAESEILMQRFYLNPRNGNLLPLSDSRADRSLGVTQERFLPLVVDEVAQKDAGQNVWRVRHLDWTPTDGEWNRNTPDLDIKINGVSILQRRNPNNPTQFILQEPVADAQTGLLQFTYNEPVRNGSGQIVNLLNRGQIIVDPTNGTVRFVNFAPRLNDVVTVTYRPRVYRILSIAPGSAGTYAQLRAVFQRTMNPRHQSDNPAGSPVRRGVENGACSAADRPPVDRAWLFFRRSGPAPNTTGNFFFKTLRPGVRLQSPVLTQRGRLPVQSGAFTLAQGTNHIVVRLTPNNVAGAGLGFYEYDALRGNIYFTTEDIGKEVIVRYLARDRAGNIVELEETLIVRWLDEGNLARSFATEVEYTSPVPIDLPTNELYLWAMPNLELRQTGQSLFTDPYGGLDESLLLFWSSTRNGVGNIYGGALQPRFYISPFDPDRD